MTLLLFIAPIVLAILLSYGLTPLASALAFRVGAVDSPGDRKIHTMPTPRLGGLAVVGSIVIVISTLSIVRPLSAHQLAPEVLLALAAGLLPIVIVSIIDDIRPQRAALKFAAHLAGATTAVVLGIRLNGVVHFGGQEIAIGWLAIPISILWLAGITNAFNLIDGLDGLSAGLALISALSLVAVSLVTGRYGMAATAAVLAGAILGFLPYNLFPAKVYLGDSGATTIGFLLAALTLSGGSTTSAGLAVTLPVVVLGIPLADTVLSMARRFVKRVTGGGGNIFEADRSHIHHRLLALGYRHHRAVLLLYGVGVVLALLAFASLFMTHQNAALLLGTLLVAAIVGIAKLGYDEFAIVKSGVVLRFYEAPVVRKGMFVVFADLTMIAMSLYVAIGLKYDDWGVREHRDLVVGLAALLPACTLLVFGLMRIYRRSWSIASVDDVAKLSTAVVVANAGTFVLSSFFIARSPSASFMVLYTLVTLVVIIGSRSSYRLLYQWNLESNRDGELVLIYGAGKAGAMALREILSNSDVPMRPVGFIDDDPAMRGRFVNGYPVLGDLDDLADVVVDMKTRGVVIASDKIPVAKVQSARRTCESRGAWMRVFKVGFGTADPDLKAS